MTDKYVRMRTILDMCWWLCGKGRHTHKCIPNSVLWNVYGDCENYAVMKGHTGAIMELHFSADGR